MLPVSPINSYWLVLCSCVYPTGVNGVCETLVFCSSLATPYRTGTWFNSSPVSIPTLSPWLCVSSLRPDLFTFFSFLCTFKWIHKKTFHYKRISDTLLSPAYLAHKTQHKGQLPSLLWQKLSLHSPSCGWKACIGLWLGESPMPPRCTCLAQLLGLKWCLRILPAPVGVTN